MTLDTLRAAYPVPDGDVRVHVHGGTCGHAVDIVPFVDELRGTVGLAFSEAGCDGACWAAPAATVVREGHTHRFARLDESGVDPLLSCVAGSCDAADESRTGLLERLGRSDGSLSDALAGGAYEAAATALAMPPGEVIDARPASSGASRAGRTSHRCSWSTPRRGNRARSRIATYWRATLTACSKA